MIVIIGMPNIRRKMALNVWLAGFEYATHNAYWAPGWIVKLWGYSLARLFMSGLYFL
jgi:hypothetical protein